MPTINFFLSQGMAASPSSSNGSRATKRQKRSEPNDKHAWPQQPKIKSPAARAKAYLRVAGLSNSNSANSTANADVLDPTLDLDSPHVKFGRLLGSPDQRTRHKAIITLQNYLKARCAMNSRGLSELDLLKMWKGLWFTLYMADKAVVQDELAKMIAKLLWCVAGTEEEDEYAAQAYMNLMAQYEDDDNNNDNSASSSEDESKEENPNTVSDDDDDDDDESSTSVTMEEVENTLDNDNSGSNDDEPSDDDDEEEEEDDDTEIIRNEHEIPHCRGAHLAALLARTFFCTVRRDWGKMDKYRVDKFYTLIRYMLREIYQYMALRHWNVGIIRLFNDTLFEEILSQTPNGLRYHVIDICLEELAKAANDNAAPMPLTEATFLDVVEPFLALVQTGAEGSERLQERVVEKVLQRFLFEYSVVSETALNNAEQHSSSDDSDNDDDNPNENNDTSQKSHLVLDQVHVGTVAKLIFDLATDGTTQDKFRKSLYDVHKQYLKRLKKVGRDVDLQQGQSDDDEDMINEPGEGFTLNEADLEQAEEAEEETLEQIATERDAPPQSEESTTTTTNKTKARKRKKKRKGSASDQDSEGPEETPVVEDEVVSISVQEQKAARKSLLGNGKSTKANARKQSNKNKNKKATDEEQSGSRRVQFGRENHAISWKKSMKSLRSRKSIDSNSAPEKSILLNKDAPVRIAKKKRRKRAVDFF